MHATDGIMYSLDEREYHAHPALSSTQARQLLDSPARYHYNLTHPQPRKDAFDLGTAVHTKVLGVGSSVVTPPEEHLTPSGAISTNAATVAWIEEQRAAGLVVIGQQQAAVVDAMAESVLAHPEARAVLEAIEGREVSVFSDVDGVPCRARFDLFDGVRAGDLKTARNASPKGFNTSVGRYGYHTQEQFYRDVHRAATGDGLESFKFLVIESTAPYLVGVYDLDFMWEDIAKERVRKARDLWRECTASGVWPGYQSTTLTPPTWAIFESQEGEEIQVA